MLDISGEGHRLTNLSAIALQRGVWFSRRIESLALRCGALCLRRGANARKGFDGRILFVPVEVNGLGSRGFKSYAFGALQGGNQIVEFLVGTNFVVQVVSGGADFPVGQHLACHTFT